MRALFFAPFLLLLASCTTIKQADYAPRDRFQNPSPIPDYDRLDYWAAHPWKHDPSDSLPAALGAERNDSLADVFFIHPTTYTGKRTGWNADINDAALNLQTDYSSILYQASVFNQHCRVFAPRYRQAHLSAFFTTSTDARAAFDTAYADVRAAFLTYLKTGNHHRPIIIAGHSQGALMAERLLAEFFDGKELYKQLVAAYVVGWPIAPGSFKNIPVCDTPGQTGCFCGWRTLRRGYIPAYVRAETTSYVTNPLSWRTDSAAIGRQANEGSILRNFQTILPHTTDAQVHGGVLWVHRPKFPGSVFLRRKNYHIGDINLFYINIRKNIEQRIAAYRR